MIQEEKINRCNGCAIHHPSQRQHSCLMMDSEDAWFYFRDDVVENIDLNLVLKTAESVCSGLVLNWESRGKHTWPSCPSYLGPASILLRWNSKDSVKSFNRTSWKIAFCMPFTTLPVDWNGKIAVVWKWTAKLKHNALKPLSENKKNHNKSPLLQNANPFQRRSQRILCRTKKPSETNHRDSQDKFTTKTAKTKWGYRAVMRMRFTWFVILMLTVFLKNNLILYQC